MKLKSLNCDETKKLRWWQTHKGLKSSNYDKTKKTKIVTKLKTLIALISNCDKTQIGTKLKFGQNSKTQNVTKLKL
jgi:hypothetical protein